jgi:hypothetical protein
MAPFLKSNKLATIFKKRGCGKFNGLILWNDLRIFYVTDCHAMPETNFFGPMPICIVKARKGGSQTGASI